MTKTIKLRKRRKKTRKAGVNTPITLEFDNVLNANEDTRKKPVRVGPYAPNTKFKTVIHDVNPTAPFPVDLTNLYTENQNPINNLESTLSQLGLHNNSKIFYIRKSIELTYPIRRTLFNKSCSTSLGIKFYSKIKYTFSDNTSINAYLGYGLKQIPARLFSFTQNEPYHFLYPQPHIIIFTNDDLEKESKDICKHPLLQPFKINHLFKTLLNIDPREQLPTYHLYKIPKEFTHINLRGSTVDSLIEDLIIFEQEKYHEKSSGKILDIGEQEDTLLSCFAFKQNDVSQAKIDMILNF